ncbi:MAG: hypothetical protein ACRD1V_01640 [Vicinamibacterales bacterium]
MPPDDDVDVVPLVTCPGIHPPLIQVPPPIKTNGSGIVQPPLDVFVVVDVVEVPVTLLTVAVVDGPDAPVMPLGIHPPLTHLPPPIVANGSGVVQPALDVPVDDDVVVVDGPLLVEPLVVAVDVFAIPLGIQPPVTQVPPPIAANGSDVVQPAADVDVLAVDVVAVDAVVVPEVRGIQPPLTQVPPPIEANGSDVLQPVVDDVDDDDVDDDDVDDDDVDVPVSVNESNAELVPTPKRPVAIQVSYVW